VDDSLLEEVSQNGAITPAIITDVQIFRRRPESRADLIFNQCSVVAKRRILPPRP
jgi:hypothetical protein